MNSRKEREAPTGLIGRVTLVWFGLVWLCGKGRPGKAVVNQGFALLPEALPAGCPGVGRQLRKGCLRKDDLIVILNTTVCLNNHSWHTRCKVWDRCAGHTEGGMRVFVGLEVEASKEG